MTGQAVTPVAPRTVAALLERVRTRRPLVHHITNAVTMNDVANATLAVGAAPVMAHAPEEVEEVAGRAGALALNLGTPTVQQVEAMLRAGGAANRASVPVVLDPVGAGGTAFRTAQAERVLAEVRIAAVRGNAGEIAALAGGTGGVRGVDATGEERVTPELVRAVAVRTGASVAATGPVDVVADATRLARVENGHPLLVRITGSGCMATAVIAAFAAVEPDAFVAAVSGLVCFGIAAELAAEGAAGPGTFRAALLDALARVDAGLLEHRARITP